MNFTSLVFFIFLPITLLLYWLFPAKIRWIVLLVASYFFYAFMNYWLIFLILATTLISYLGALAIKKYEKQKKVFLIITIILCLGTLFVFKYLDFALSTTRTIFSWFSLNLDIPNMNIILPVGISFYTFQTVAYVVDVYKEKIPVEKHIGYFALFISFFPQLVAGPIERADHLLPQLKENHSLNLEDFTEGLHFFIIGFIKKILIADFLVIFVNSVYNNLPASSGFEILLATFMFGIVIYCDFSGYSEIALGIAKWMGISLSKNFDRPYLSSSLKEFWNRWHITLNNFFTDYIYIPLGGSKKGKVRTYINIIIVFFLSGLWHGASTHFVIWGLLCGVLLIIEYLLTPLFEKVKMKESAAKIIGICLTFLIINLSWFFFRAQSLTDIGIIFSKIFTAFTFTHPIALFTPINIVMSVGVVVILPLLHYLPVIKKENTNNYSVISLYAILIILVSLMYINNLSSGGESSFIYFQF